MRHLWYLSWKENEPHWFHFYFELLISYFINGVCVIFIQIDIWIYPISLGDLVQNEVIDVRDTPKLWRGERRRGIENIRVAIRK